MLKERFQEEQCKGDWQIPIRVALMKEEDAAELKVLKDYALVDRKSTRLNSSHLARSRMPSSA